MKEIRWEKWASVAICLAAAAVLLFICFRLIFSFLLPFLLAWLLSLLITPVATSISKKTKIPQKLLSVVLFFAVLIGLAFLISISVQRILTELGKLVNRFLENGSFSTEKFNDSVEYVERLVAKMGIPAFRNMMRESMFREEFNRMITEFIQNLLSNLSAKLPNIAGKIVSSMPSVLLFTVVMVIAGFYFCLDRKKIEGYLIALLPRIIREKIPAWQARVRHFSWRYVKAYLLLLLLTFIELFVGFSILRVEYAFLLALFIAVVDLLPVLGVGTVLIPWGIIELIRRNFYLGFGLLILYLAVSVLRQILEPRFVGQSLGLHPLLTLVAGYVGWNLFGFLGMALGPVFALIIKSIASQLRDSQQEKG